MITCLACLLNSCQNTSTKVNENSAQVEKVYPSDILPFMDEFKILLGDGTKSNDLVNYGDDNFFYTRHDDGKEWVVYKAPNAGVTSKNSSNTRTELHQKAEWLPMTGGKLTANLKVTQVSVSGDPRKRSTFSTVIGQIHSGEGHENEPLKIFYKKFPGHTKGSVFWNYEINTEGSNEKRWDHSQAVWGYDMSVVGKAATDFPNEPADGIALGEEFSYEVNVFEGVMYLTFSSKGHETIRFTKSLIKSEFTKLSDLPHQTKDLYLSRGRGGVEQPSAYANELCYFKQGAYNQTNCKNAKIDFVWCNKDSSSIAMQYEHGYYTEVWFSDATIGPGTPPVK